METLSNEQVKHNKFGQGIIRQASEGILKIKFEAFEAEKIFIYPGAFENFLVFEKESLQQKTMALIQMEKEKKEAEEEVKRKAYEIIEEERRKEKLEKIKKQKKAEKTKEDKKKALKV